MGFNAKELDNLSADEKVKILMERLKEYETLKCSEKNCDSDLTNEGWTIYKNRKLCSRCYKKEYDKDKQPDMNLIVEYYLKKVKSVSIINEAKSKINMTEEEFQLLIKPFKTDNTENLEYMRAIAEHYIIARLAQGSINSLRKKHHMSPEEYEELIDPFKLEFESKPKKITIAKILNKRDNAQLNTQSSVKTSEDSALESESKIEVHSTHNESQDQTQAQKEGNTPKKESAPPIHKRFEGNATSKQNTPPMQQHKEENTSGTQGEMGKQEENENLHSSIGQEEEKIVTIKGSTSAQTKEHNLEEQNTNTQFVTKVDSEIVFGGNEQPNQIIERKEKTSSSELEKNRDEETSLFDDANSSLFDTNTNLNTNEQKKPIPFTSFPGFDS
ncbi:hypothetical protein P4679_23540 [Priestia megaterium]|uniref:hypothetical protein n=1 Tax=Priestia megaterium TaxID=1404 RepID=UPI002E1F47C3|nr:hypothetical protein [Priestia megaterium]